MKIAREGTRHTHKHVRHTQTHITLVDETDDDDKLARSLTSTRRPKSYSNMSMRTPSDWNLNLKLRIP